jgi:hypothetical protein
MIQEKMELNGIGQNRCLKISIISLEGAIEIIGSKPAENPVCG